MSKLSIKLIILLMACLCMFMMASCAFASDADGMNNVTAIDDANSNDALEIPVQQTSVENANGNPDVGTFIELDQEMKNLKPGEIYWFDKDYTFDEKTDNSSRTIDIAADNVVIDGRTHTIDASGASGVTFKVTGNNIYIKNLKFNNFHGQTGESVSSPIQWNGNGGTCDYCDFNNNVGVNGGAISWSGDNGAIIQGYFVNNTALNYDGTVAVTGDNVKIVKSLFYIHQGNAGVQLSENKGKPTTLYVDGTYFECDGRTSGFTNIAYDKTCKVIRNGIDLDNGDYNQLCHDLENLKPGEYYNIISDYAIVEPKGDLARNRIINIRADNVTINGNGHTIDARASENYFGIFNVTGNNVTILNLQITHSRAYDIDYLYSGKNIYGDDYNHLISPIEWHGDRGVISNCKFIDNTGFYGGAISWNANNGIIENCVFDNNAANFGGSVYINGTNNIVRNGKFKDSYTTFHYESIYFTCHDNPYGDVPEYLIIYGCSFEGTLPGGENISADDGCVVLIDCVNPSKALEPCNFRELIDDLKNLKDNDIYTLSKDYYVKAEPGMVIRIDANNVTINANGHTIFGKDPYSTLLYVHGNDVKINNLNIGISNGKLKSDSFINWMGDNGELTNCTFIGGYAENGGALKWSGNNGIIDGCLFNKNIATLGGAIYLTGTNNTIGKCTFRNSIAKVTDEAIYYNNGNGLLTITGCDFDCVKIWIDDDSEVTIDGKSVPKTFSELRDELLNLKENESYDIYRNYQFIPKLSLTLTTNNIVINGNKHVIYVKGALESPVFYVAGNGTNINNLNMNNSNAQNGESFIAWIGDDGIFTDCALVGNIAENGGAILWKGNNGLINNCLFLKNTATFGGAIYVDGSNNKISNSYFIQTGSRLSSEAIYINPERKKLTLENIFFDGISGAFIDGKEIKIDVKNINELSFEGQVADEHLNINPLIYISITKGGINYYNDNVYFFSKYYNETGDFIFTLTKEFNESGIIYSKEYHIKNIFNDSFDDVYTALYNGKYENTFSLAITKYVASASDYGSALNIFSSFNAFKPIDDFFKDDKNHSITSGKYITHQLNVIFTKSLIIDCASTWDLSASPYDAVFIDGNGSVIRGSYEDREEEKWVSINEEKLKEDLIFFATNLLIEGFNTAVENLGGQCIFDTVHFHKNKMDYIIDRDWGAGILNTGIVTCTNCVFTENYAKNGGAIFNQGLLTMENCLFGANEGYGEGDDVCMGEGGKVIFDGVEITGNNQHESVHFAESMNIFESTLLTVGCVAVSFLIGTFVGFFTFNPAIGIGVGLLVGGALGVGASAIIIKNTYDANFDRLTTILTLSLGSAFAGAAGGYMGYYESNQFFLDRGRHLYLADGCWGASSYFHWGSAAARVGIAFGLTDIIVGAVYFVEHYDFK